MAWYVCLARFCAGLVLANGVPHFVNGISGKRFPTPFASPPGAGTSSPVVNVIWGMINLLIAYVLIVGVGDFVCGLTFDALLVALGVSVAAAGLAWHFGRVRGS